MWKLFWTGKSCIWEARPESISHGFAENNRFLRLHWLCPLRNLIWTLSAHFLQHGRGRWKEKKCDTLWTESNHERRGSDAEDRAGSGGRGGRHLRKLYIRVLSWCCANWFKGRLKPRVTVSVCLFMFFLWGQEEHFIYWNWKKKEKLQTELKWLRSLRCFVSTNTNEFCSLLTRCRSIM